MMKRLWHKLTQREKTLAVAALCILILVLARYLLLTPFLERREWVRDQLEMQPQLLEKHLRYLNQKKEIAAALEAARAELKAIEPSLLSGDTPSVSASGLQQTVQGLAEKEGVQVITTRVLNPEVKGPFTKIPIQVEVSTKIDQLVNLIRGIESSEKLLVVDELNVRSLFRPIVAARQRLAPQPTDGQLRVGLIVSGFVRSEPPATKREAGPGTTRADSGKTPNRSSNKVSE
jgi:Tfp pilus assembly protein PilO